MKKLISFLVYIPAPWPIVLRFGGSEGRSRRTSIPSGSLFEPSTVTSPA